MVQKVCRFFALGTCSRGEACSYSHAVSSSSSIPPGAVTFDPRPRLTNTTSSAAETKRIPCRFHLLGRCNKGNDCPYEHSNAGISTSNETHKVQPEDVIAAPEPKSYPMIASQQSTRDLETRNLRGASVSFGPGAQVSDLEFPSDYSAIQMTSLQPNHDAEAFQRFMATLGETVPLSSIRVKAVAKPPSTVAIARIRDSGFAQRLKSKADTGVEGSRVSGIVVSILQVGVTSESSANRLQMSTVSCIWYKPSRVAWLQYDNTGKARATERFIISRDFKIARRKIQATLQIPKHRSGPDKPTITSVQIGNLDASTPQSLIERHIPSHLTPTKLIMGKTSYSTSLSQAEECVKSLLGGIGPLEAWEPNSTTSATQVKAIARFHTAEDARKAVSQLNKQKMAQFGNSKLFVSPLISVKFNVPKAMYRAIRSDVDQLGSRIWDAEHIHIKAYPPADPPQKLITIRFYGEDTKAVAKAKSAFEKILAGEVAMNGESRIWDDFFASPGGLVHLNELSHTHQGYIYRDMRMHRLALYGSVDSKASLRSALIEKLDSLMEMTHHISLGPEDLKKALHGGFRRIVATLGKQKASLDVRQRPQIITIKGSARDLETARALLDQDVATHLENLALDKNTDRPDCVVCWTEAEDAYRTPCGHFYCGSCFASQCSSAGEDDLPVRCYGDRATCLRVLAIHDIKNALSPDSFEQLLEDSFATHVRTNPHSFQYCPTPDCHQTYRVSASGVIVTCPACLTPICTTCQVISHDGLTCALYQRLGTQGDEEFRAWKRENDVKDCPVCRVPIEKSYGCNHMQCGNCKVHMCWACLETFYEEGKCYGHMREVHSSFVDEGDGWDGWD